METKINIAEILKDKPQGTKLYNLLYNIDVELDTIVNTGTKTIVWCTDKIDNNDVCHRFYSEFGTIEGYPDGLQILLPSKEMRDWSKFAWKRGDVLLNSSGFKLFFDRWANDDYTRFFGKVNLLEDSFSYETEKYTLASKEENLDTLEIEKSEFKDGDILIYKSEKFTYFSSIFILNTNRNEISSYVRFSIGKGSIDYDVPVYNLGTDRFRYATEEEKQQLFSALAKKGKAWDAEKKAIVNLESVVELKPFDKVLVRDSESDNWRANLFGYIGKDGYYHCVYANWVYCIPYIGNESLLGTTKDVEG